MGKAIYDCNCYGVSTDKAALIIDPSVFDKNLTDFFEENADKEKLILITHAHPDHISGAEELREKTGVKIGIGEFDAPLLKEPASSFNKKIMFDSDMLLKDGEEIALGDIVIKVIHTPGHTRGGVCYLMGKTMFSGDTLFCETIGRTDLPTGSFKDMRESLEKLIKLDPSIKVCPGHGRSTTIENEIKYNPYILGLSYS